jgi:hypothetical protein
MKTVDRTILTGWDREGALPPPVSPSRRGCDAETVRPEGRMDHKKPFDQKAGAEIRTRVGGSTVP